MLVVKLHFHYQWDNGKLILSPADDRVYRCTKGNADLFDDQRGRSTLQVVRLAEDEQDQSPRRWTSTKRQLLFCFITQDGDVEGGLHLDRPPRLAGAQASLTTQLGNPQGDAWQVQANQPSHG